METLDELREVFGNELSDDALREHHASTVHLANICLDWILSESE
jgi:hypothetical protein